MRLDAVFHDLRIALRGWRRAPGVAATAVLTLALGIGAATAVFTIAHTVLVRPLPYRDADRLVVVRAEQDYEGASRPVAVQFQTEAVAAWPREPRAFASIAFYAESVGALNQPTGSELVNVGVVEGPFFETLEGRLLTGRALAEGDGADPVAVISARVWRRHFAGAPDVLGRALTLNGRALTIVGVAADDFLGPLRRDDVWTTAGNARAANPRCCGFTPIARLAPGVSMRAAAEELDGTARSLAEQMPRALAGTRVRLVPLRETMAGRVRPALLVLAGAVALLLVLAIANVASLLLARHAARLHEVGVRRALGASSWRLLREGLAEGAWLCAAGGIGGVVVAWGAVRLVRTAAADVLPRTEAMAIDGVALGLAIALAVLVTLAVGLVPVLASSGAIARLRREDRGYTASPRARFALRAITAAQLAISVVLLVSASLLGRSLVALVRTDMGVVSERVATASINLAMGRTLTSAAQADLVARIVERVGALPGVVSAGVGTSRPPDVSRMRLTLTRGSDPNARASYQAAGVPVTPGYFPALGIQLQRGRFFTDADRADAPPVVVLSAGTARRLFGDRDPVGERIGLPVLRDGRSASEQMTVVGVVADVRFNGLDRQADDVVYRPYAQQAWVSAFLVVRTTLDADVVAAQLAKAVATVDPAVAVSDARSMDAVLSAVTMEPRLRSVALAGVSLLALVIAGVGLHGVSAYAVSQRRAELGVRMALGADARRIRRMVVGEGLGLAALGAGLGLAGAFGATRLLSGLLYGVTATDAASFVVAAVAAMASGVAGSYVPARRAGRTDPAVVLRGE